MLARCLLVVAMATSIAMVQATPTPAQAGTVKKRPPKKKKKPKPPPKEVDKAEEPVAVPEPIKKPSPPPTTGKVEIMSTTNGASVTIDGRLVGTVPISKPVELQPGEHIIKISLKGFIEQSKTITLTAGGSIEVEVDLIPEPTKTQVHRKWHASIFVGAGSADEAETPGTTWLSAQADFAYSPMSGLKVGAGFRDAIYEQTYYSASPPINGPGPLSASSQREQLQDIRIWVSYNALDTVTSLLSLEFGFEPRFLNLVSESFSMWAFGLGVYGVMAFHPTDNLHIGGGAGWTGHVATSDNPRSVFGAPLSVIDFHAGIGWDVGDEPWWTVEFRWQAQQLHFERTTRFYHGAVFGLRFAL